MKLYSYDKNGFMSGSFDAQKNPMKHLIGEDEFLIAANSTALPPLKETTGKINQFVKGKWTLVPVPIAAEPLAENEATKAANELRLKNRQSALVKLKKVAGLTDDELSAIS